MKLPGKPISSPGRAEKYPPPLMRFLSSNVGSRSRGRSRSSPMFVRRKNTSATAIETQEPSSPKVTCMGQVRVRRSKNQNQSKPRSGKSKRRCKWMRNALFCRQFAGKLKPRCSKPDLRKWVMFFHCGFKRKSKIREEKSKIEPEFSNRSEENSGEEEEEDEEEAINTARDYFSGAVSPPKNALVLTRSRSAPYRSSSLACRFWGSPVKNEETEQKQSISSPVNGEETEQKQSISPKDTLEEDGEIRSPESENLCKNSDQLDEESEELEGSIENPSKIEGESVHPLILTRCKSEPARIAEKLDPELSLLKKRRLGFT